MADGHVVRRSKMEDMYRTSIDLFGMFKIAGCLCIECVAT